MIIDLQRSLRRLGKIRMGDQQATRTGGTRPAKLDKWRITSPNLDLLTMAAAIYGGEPRRWEGSPDGEQFELYTTTDTLDIIVPPGPTILDQHYELWSGGGCQRRCDGVTDNLNCVPCQCPTDHEVRDAMSKDGKACKITTRLSVILPRVPDIGTWMLESHGYYAAVELAGAMEILAMASATGRLVPANLRMQPRTAKRDGQTRRYVVPIIELPTLSAGTLMTGEAPALPEAPRQIAPPQPAAIGSGGGGFLSAEEPAATSARTPAPPPELPGDDLDPGRPFTVADQTLAGPEFVRRFAATVKAGDGKNRDENDRLRHALVAYGTGGRTSSSKAVLKTELDAVREAWHAYQSGALAYSDADDGTLVEVAAEAS